MKRLLFICFIVALFANSTFAQKQKYQSLFIYNFTKYIQWPESYGSEKFVIGVIGDSEIFESLEEMASKKKTTATGEELVIEKYESAEDMGHCNVLFLSSSAAGELSKIDKGAEAKPILIITESPGLATQGSVINFVELNDKIRFELNKKEAVNRGLIVSGELSSLAIVI